MAETPSQLRFERLLAGESAATAEIAGEYLPRLAALVRGRMSARLLRRIDPEDVVQSAYRSFFLGARAGKFALDEPGDLWRLLAGIALNKLRGQVEHHTAGRRAIGREDSLPADVDVDGAKPAPRNDPGAETLAALEDELAQVVGSATPLARQVLELRLRDEPIETIAAAVERTPRTVRRILSELRTKLERRLDPIAEERLDLDVLPLRAPLAWNDYRLLAHAGSGGIGKVYRAVRVADEQPVAIKTLRKMWQRQRPAVERFLHEGELLATLRHPGLVGLHGIGRFPGGGFFLVLDLVTGENLAERLRRGPVPAGEAVSITRAVAEAVDYVHRQEVVHCDLKPANVLLEEPAIDGEAPRVRVTDFGFAQLLQRAGDRAIPAGGTPGFSAPEQLDPALAPLSPATDVFGLGGILYALLTGQPPRDAATLAAAIEQCRAEAGLTLAFLDTTPPGLAALCRKCLARRAAERFQSAAEVVAALDAFDQ